MEPYIFTDQTVAVYLMNLTTNLTDGPVVVSVSTVAPRPVHGYYPGNYTFPGDVW